MKFKIILMVGILFPCFSSAQTTINENDIVVTANRMQESKTSVLADIHSVTARQIESHNISSLSEALSLLPGIQVFSYGGKGQAANFYVRGGKAEHVLVLLDGNTLNTSGIAAINPNFIPTNMIEKIEFIRGQRATVYGANAISGVINIITKPNYKNKQSLKYSYSSYDTHELGFNNTLLIDESTVLKIAGGASKSDGFNIHPQAGLNDGTKYGYKSKNLNLNISHLTPNNIELWASYNYLFNRGEYDNSYFDWATGDPIKEKDRNDVERNIVSIGSKYGSDSYNYDYGFMYTNSNEYSYPIGDSKIGHTASPFKINALSTHFTNDFVIFPGFKFGFGGEFDNNVLNKDSSSYGQYFSNDDKSLVNRALFACVNSEQGIYLAELSYRVDDNSSYGTHHSFSVGGGLNFNNYAMFSLKYGTAYRSPTLMELYYPLGGNTNLREEKSKNIEFGFKGNLEYLGYYSNFYYTKMSDLIGYDMNTWKYYNVSEAIIKGVELGTDYNFEKIIFGLSVDLLDPKDSNTDETIKYRAKQMYKAHISGELGKFNFSGLYNFVSKRYTSAKPLGGFALVNIATGYTWQNKVKFGLSIENLMDKNYQLSSGYLTGGRIYTASIELINFY